MKERPALGKNLSAADFRSYYYLKKELMDFCRREGMQTAGSKEELTERIAVYLSSGKKTAVAAKRQARTAATAVMTKETLIESPFVCSERHRAFFKEAVGPGFSFNVAFQNWLKGNGGKTYGDAVIAYYQILEDKKKGATVIGRQFEYNTYIRAFFADNPGKNLQDAIRCWKYKKSMPGHNRYEKEDLAALQGKIKTD